MSFVLHLPISVVGNKNKEFNRECNLKFINKFKQTQCICSCFKDHESCIIKVSYKNGGIHADTTYLAKTTELSDKPNYKLSEN